MIAGFWTRSQAFVISVAVSHGVLIHGESVAGS